MFVVFDTNIYRTLVNRLTGKEALDSIRKIKERESEKEVKSLFSSTVASELISHILDGDKFEEDGDCTKALRVMYSHCGNNKEYGAVPSPEVQLAKELFNKEDTSGIQRDKEIVNIAYDLYLSPTETTVEKHLRNIETITKHNSDVERSMAEYLIGLAKFWRTSKDSEADKASQIKEVQSLALISSIAEKVVVSELKFDETDEFQKDLNLYVQIYKERYPVPLQMMVDFCKKLSDGNFIPDKPERVNQVWDQRILHVAGQRIGEKAVILVTNDNAMLDAARNSATPKTSVSLDPNKYKLDPAAVSNNVMSYSDYCLWLGFKD